MVVSLSVFATVIGVYIWVLRDSKYLLRVTGKLRQSFKALSCVALEGAGSGKLKNPSHSFASAAELKR